MRDYLAVLRPGGYYHVYNSAVGKEKLFIERDNYRYFLANYQKYISPISDTYAYCLMRNHFHFFRRCKDENVISEHFLDSCKNVTKRSLYRDGDATTKEKFLCDHSSRQFANFFNGYTQAINLQEGRRGGLFCSPFKRIFLDTDEYRRNTIAYIHHNPVNAKLCAEPKQYEHSSYNHILAQLNNQNFTSESGINLDIGGILELFGEKENFIQFHNYYKYPGGNLSNSDPRQGLEP